MRKQVWIPLVIFLAVCLFLLIKMRRESRVAPAQQSEALGNRLGQAAQPQAPAYMPSSNILQQLSLPANATTLSRELSQTRPVAGMRLALWQVTINFYGKVVDESSNPVPDATVTFKWMEIPSSDGDRTSGTVSGTDGLFSLRNERGPSLEVWVSKAGYYASHGGRLNVSYALGQDIISPDPRNPVIFLLRRKGAMEPLIIKDFPPGIGQIWQLHHDGTPVELDLLNGTKVSAGQGQLKLEFWRDVSDKNASQFDWKLQLSMSGGGLQETEEEFAFQAPESGYLPSIGIDMPATNQNWQNDVRSKYYIRLPDGKYGRIDFYLMPYNGAFTLQSAVNPSGSRNLEFDPSNPAQAGQ